MVFPPPHGPKPTAEQILELDTDYLSGDVPGYFRHRVEGLIAWHEAVNGALVDAGIGLQIAQLTGLPPDRLSASTQRARQMQVAADAFAVRHHVAETLVRFLEARATSLGPPAGSVSLMFTIGTGKTVTAQVIDDLEAMVDSDRALLSQLLLPLAVRSAAFRPDARVRFEAMARWIGRAFTLLQREDLQFSAGSNKVKHGMALRAADDVRIEFYAGDLNPDGTLPLSGFVGPQATSVPVIDRPFMALVTAKPSKDRAAGPAAGADLLYLQLDTATLLAEAACMNEVLAAALHVAAEEHAARTGKPDPLPAYPDVSSMWSPVQVLRDRPVAGLRLPLTERTDGQAGRPFAVLGQWDGQGVEYAFPKPGTSTTISER